MHKTILIFRKGKFEETVAHMEGAQCHNHKVSGSNHVNIQSTNRQ